MNKSSRISMNKQLNIINTKHNTPIYREREREEEASEGPSFHTNTNYTKSNPYFSPQTTHHK